MHHLILIRIPREIPQIQNVFYIQFLTGLLVDLSLVLFNNLYYTASYGTVS